MRLLLHIFRKDVRHFLPEIAVNLTLLAVFAWVAPDQWHRDFLPSPAMPLAPLLRLLLPLGWLVLISRVVHDESLVGDRQFWITRPYPRGVLLAAKIAFVLAFVHLPVFLMQCYLLHHADLAVLPALGSLLRYQLLLAVLFTLPFMTLAVVTRSFGRHLLTVIAGILYLIAMGALANWLTKRQMMPPFFDWFSLGLATLTMTGAVVLMYLRRPVAKVRIALAALPIVLVLLLACTPVRPLVRQVYAAGGGQDDLLFQEGPKHQTTGTGEPAVFDGQVSVHIPVHLRTAGDAHVVQFRGAQLTLRADDGTVWTSPYEVESNWVGLDGTGSIELGVPQSIFAHLRNRPVHAELEAVADRFRPLPKDNRTVPAHGDFATAYGGVCNANNRSYLLECRYPLQSPPPAFTVFELQSGRCDAGAARELTTRGLTGGDVSLSPDLDPVTLRNITYREYRPQEHGARIETVLCPGALVSTTYQVSAGHERMRLGIPSLLLPLYVEHRNDDRD